MIRDGQMFAVKVTSDSGHAEVKRAFATEVDANAWIANHWAKRAARVNCKNRLKAGASTASS